MATNFTIGVSALNASQRALEVIGQNIANANTPGYHRQVVRLASRAPIERQNLSIGLGVDVTQIRRMRSNLLETALTDHRSELSNSTAQLEFLRRVESMFSDGDGSLNNLLEKFFNGVEQLTTRPDDLALRRVVFSTSTALTAWINELAESLQQLRTELDQQIERLVEQINSLAPQISELNFEIQRLEVRGIDANVQRDQRDQLLQELSELVDHRTTEQDHGVVRVQVAGAFLAGVSSFSQLQSGQDTAGNAIVTAEGLSNPLQLFGGRLAGLLEVRNGPLPDYQNRLEQLATELIQGIDSVQSTGLGLSEPLAFLAGHRSVSDVTAPLSQAGLALAPQNGSLFISITDQNTGARTLTEVPITPSTMSLQDVATAISAVPNVQAIAETQTGTLQILAANGFAVDFAGRLVESPDTSAISGTTVPVIGGGYTGASNDTLTFQVSGSGTVGVTTALTLNVQNAAGQAVASLNIGQGYEPGSAIDVIDGVTVSVSSGTANNTDNFSTQVVAQPDTAGILTALGINTFFTGTNAGNIQVNSDLLSDPGRLSGSRSGQPSDGLNFRRMASLRDAPVLVNGTQTLRQGYSELVGDIGSRIQNLDQQESFQIQVLQQLEAQQQSVSGVDPNEELVHLVQFQRQFQIAARYVAITGELLEDLVRIV